MFDLFITAILILIASTISEGKFSGNCNLTEENDNLMDINFTACDEVHFNISRVYLNGTLLLTNLSRVAFFGHNTRVECSPNSGVYVSNVISIKIASISFLNCGILHSHQNAKLFRVAFQSALYFFNVFSVTLSYMSVNESIGTGLVILNCKQVTISDSIFANNSWNNESSLNSNLEVAGGGGIHVDLSCGNNVFTDIELLENCRNATIIIMNCFLLGNKARNFTKPGHKDFGDDVFTSFGKGGGLALHIRDKSSNNYINTTNCTFCENYSHFGGGAEIVLFNGANSNSLQIANCIFLNNFARNSSGGLDISYVGEGIDDNNITISLTNFTGNHAPSGGAIALFFLYSSIHVQSSIAFSEVQWINNSAHYGAAFFIYPLFTEKRSLEPQILFKNTCFVNNSVFSIKFPSGLQSLGEGIIMTTRQSLEFENSVLFQGNDASCIYATSSAVYFSHIDARFINNSGLYGAGLALIGFSSLNLGENTTLIFCNNSVTFLGSAISHHSIDKTSYVYPNFFCFIQLPNIVNSLRIYLYGNNASNSAHQLNENISSVIYANSYSSCIIDNFKQLFSDGIIKWTDKCLTCHPQSIGQSNNNNSSSCHGSIQNKMSTICHSGVSAEENEIKLSSSSVDFIPGIPFQLPITITSHLSDICNSSFSTNESSFFVAVKNVEGSNIASVLTNVDTRSISRYTLMGVPGDVGQLTLTETSFRKLQVQFNVTALECPPLFNLSSNRECKCIQSEVVPYPEFHSCSSKQAKIRMGFWVGYEKNTSSGSLLISHCPPGFCSKKNVDSNSYISLPEERDATSLSDIICNNRSGTLCGLCKPNFTVYFHDKSFQCKEKKICSLGPLFYILSEIIPLTLLFFVLIFFDIRLTAGYLNGFVFFAQMYNSITHIGEAFVSSHYHKYSSFHRVMYMFFDFDFFSVEGLSFCLFSTRSALNVVIVKYFTVLYALLLVFGTIWFLNTYGTKLKCVGIRQFKYSALQGLSAFFVIVYSQCTQVSFRILNFAKIYKINGNSSQYVPFLQGDIDYFRSDHLYYAIPAILCIIGIVVPLPTLLIAYPLYQKMISILNIENSLVSNFVSKILPVSKLKPFLDTLQGSFKDEFRFFAGFYFVYRVIIIATILQERIEWIHTAIEIVLVCITGLHVLVWPYQKRLHNIIDGLLFCNLIIIVIIKRFIFTIAEKGNKHENEIKQLFTFQLLLINIPLACIFFVIVYHVIRKVLPYLKKNTKKIDENKKEMSNLDNSILNDDARGSSLEDSYKRTNKSRPEKAENVSTSF